MTYNDYITLLSSFATKNKYHKWYIKLIDRAKTRVNINSIKHMQSHHIVPKSFNVDANVFINSKNNLVSLTTREHILAHRLLTKFIVGDNYFISLKAYYAMCFYKLTSSQKKSVEVAGKLIRAIEKPYNKFLIDGEWLYNNYVIKNKSTRVLAEELSCSRRTLVMALQRANIERRILVDSAGIPLWSPYDNLFELKDEIQELVYRGLNNTIIAGKYKVDKSTIQRWNKILEIKPRLWQLKDKQWLYSKYYEELLSMEQIAKELNCNPATVKKWMGRLDIPIRSLQEAADLRKNRDKIV
jgi:transposase